MDERLEEKAEHLWSVFPEDAVGYIELRYNEPGDRNKCLYLTMTVEVRSRFHTNPLAVATYKAVEPMTFKEAQEWAEAKAKQLEEDTE